jgi:hypothetical protein
MPGGQPAGLFVVIATACSALLSKTNFAPGSSLDSYSEGMKNRLSMLGGHAEDSEQAAHASAKRFVVVVDR